MKMDVSSRVFKQTTAFNPFDLTAGLRSNFLNRANPIAFFGTKLTDGPIMLNQIEPGLNQTKPNQIEPGQTAYILKTLIRIYITFNSFLSASLDSSLDLLALNLSGKIHRSNYNISFLFHRYDRINRELTD